MDTNAILKRSKRSATDPKWPSWICRRFE